ncbi:MAG TPA: hypothetical protein VK838_04385 [Candidatus Limnocylindrales bacterium]|nr:hypothetical protein [Candidatus Limnocylindrales bacterium]
MIHRTRTRRLAAVTGGMLASLIIATSVMAHECTNASKSDPMAGAQVLIGVDGQILWTTPGLAARLARGLISPEGEGFHGIAAFDIDGDGVADASTWLGVGPDGEIPLEAQLRGPACKGITNLFVYFEQCMGG